MKKFLFPAIAVILGLVTTGLQASPVLAAEPVCTITVTDSYTTIQGTNLGDVICITGDNNTVNALGGDDTVIDDGTDNTINLGEGFDMYDGTGGDGSTVDGGAGADAITGTPGEDELSGGDGDDTLIGGEEADEINGDSGADSIDGGDGSDVVSAGDGDDSVLGGPGDDSLNGGLGADELTGDAGADNLFGEEGTDTLAGGDGDDLVAGGADLDSINGGAGLNTCDFTEGEALTTTCKYDDAAPVVSDITWAPDAIDVGSSSATTRVTFTVSDDTGVRYSSLTCASNKNSFRFYVISDLASRTYRILLSLDEGQTSSAPIQVDDFRVLEIDQEITFPLGHKPGSFECSSYSQDVLGLVSNVWKKTTFTINRTGGDFDDQAPVVSDVAWEFETFDVGASAVKNRITFTVADETGVRAVSLGCSSGQNSFSIAINTDQDKKTWTMSFSDGVTFFDSNPVTVDDFQLLKIEQEVIFPLGFKPGVYTCSQTSYDVLQNTLELQNKTSLTVIRSGEGFDESGPVVSGIAWAPNVLDVGSAAAKTRITFTVEDQTGVKNGSLFCTTDGGAKYFLFSFSTNQASKTWVTVFTDGLNTSYSESMPIEDFTRLQVDQEVTLPLGALPGVYHCDTNSVDALKNVSSEFQATTFTINRTPAGQPSAPSNLEFLPSGTKTGSLSWSAPASTGNPALNAYVTEYSTDGESWQLLPKSGTQATSLDVSGLQAGTEYWFRVRGENGGTVGQDTTYMNLNWASIKIKTPVPTVADSPRALEVSNLTSSGFSLAWLAPAYNGGSSITDFKVEVSTDGGETWRLAKQSESTSQSVAVSGAAPGTQYLVRVSAINEVGASDYLTGSVKTAPVAPSAPRTLVSGNVASTSLTLSWQLPTSNGGSAITDYRIELSSNNGTSWTTVNDGVSNALSATISNLRNVTAYQFRVSAINEIGSGIASAALSTQTLASVSTGPRSLSTAKPTTSGLTLSWKLPTSNGGSAITDYRVEVSSNCNTFTAIKRTASKNLGLKVTGLKAGTKYCFRVSAVNAVGVSATSSVVSAVTAGNAPSAPTSLSVKASKTSVVLGWKASTVSNGSTVRNYIVEYSKNNGGTWIKVTKPLSTSTKLTVTGLKTKTNYLFRVTATNDVGNSQASKSLRVTTP